MSDSAGSRLAQRVAIVTGAGGGIGRVIASTLANDGAAVAVVDVKGAIADTVAAEISANGGRASAFACDVADPSDVTDLVPAVQDALGEVDILVNNAYHAAGDDILGSDVTTWDATMTGVVKGAVVCSRAVLPGMIERRRGAVINIASANALTFLGHDAYSAAKAAMLSLTRSIAVRYGPFGIRANAVAPGTISSAAAAESTSRHALAKWYPLGRIGEPGDVANAVRFLASEEASWITGVVLPVDGGLLAGNALLARELAEEHVR